MAKFKKNLVIVALCYGVQLNMINSSFFVMNEGKFDRILKVKSVFS